MREHVKVDRVPKKVDYMFNRLNNKMPDNERLNDISFYNLKIRELPKTYKIKNERYSLNMQ
jgi:hypothetical protein